jgi:hypothetical protein
MKKIFWIPIMIILFLGVGFLYMVKNPELPISHTILTSLGITMTTGTTPSDTDLSGCVNYFDGCNTCEVKDGKISSCTESICQTLAQPKCNEYAWTGIDLTNCISYFDGCNNCTVENGKPSACTLMYCETPAEPKCTQYATGTQPASDPTCVSYFDGCNTCSKSPNNGPTACTEMYCETPSEPKCLEYAT